MKKFIVIGTGNVVVSSHNLQRTADAACEKHNKKYPSQPAIVAETNTTICSCRAGEQAVTLSDTKNNDDNVTVGYVAKPQDSRCSWWAIQLPADIELTGERIPAPFLRMGADLELKEGDMIVTSEARHHRKNRGYDVFLSVCVDGDVKTIFPLMQRKQFIKSHGGKDLMHESGDVNGCVRMAVWLRRQPSLSEAFNALLNA